MHIVELPNFPGYGVSDDGRIWSRRTPRGTTSNWRELTPVLRRGYARGGFWVNRKLRWVSVHRLVLETFVGPCPSGYEACHRDNDRANNRLENLRWDTPSGNKMDSLHKMRRGECHKDAKLKESDIPQIRALVAGGATRRAVGARFGVSHTVVNGIIGRTLWRHVP